MRQIDLLEKDLYSSADYLILVIQVITGTDMRFAEILLRLGCNLVGWMIIYSHCIWLAVIPQIGCGPEGDEIFRLLLGFSPVAIGAALLLGLAHKLPTVVGYLKWMALPLVLLIPLTVSPVLAALETTTFGSMGFCESIAASGWQRAWAPIQVVTLLIIVAASILFVAKRN